MLEQIDISQPWVIAGAALVLVVLVALLLWMRKNMHARHNKSLKDEISDLADHVEDAFNQTREVQQKEQDTEEKNIFFFYPYGCTFSADDLPGALPVYLCTAFTIQREK